MRLHNNVCFKSTYQILSFLIASSITSVPSPLPLLNFPPFLLVSSLPHFLLSPNTSLPPPIPSFLLSRLGYSRGDSHKACPTVGRSKRGGVSVDTPPGSTGLQPQPGEQPHSWHMIYDRSLIMNFKYAPPPFCNLSLSTKRRGGLYVGCNNFSRDYALPSGALRSKEVGRFHEVDGMSIIDADGSRLQ